MTKKTVNFQFRGIFRGYHATLLRESIGNAMFFVTYEYSRYCMHLQLGSASNLCSQQKKAAIDVGVGIISGGLSGIAVRVVLMDFCLILVESNNGFFDLIQCCINDACIVTWN